ncbi:MAG: TIGR04282 family arsenosugar biosynthesis glycosyltransferase [Hyphomicrobiaceae bacterium]
MRSVAVGIFCKTPATGFSKTRLSPPLRPEDCSAISACFIRDLAGTIHSLGGDATPYAVYTPVGTEPALRALLPPSFRLLPQRDGDFGTRLSHSVTELLRAGHAGAILVNADSPTLPVAILQAAVDALLRQDVVVLSPSFDGGYTLVGLSRPHPQVFSDIPWSTPHVHRLTMQRAAEINVPVINVPGWYDVDDRQTLQLLKTELAGKRLPFAEPGLKGADAPATRQFLTHRLAPLEVEASW